MNLRFEGFLLQERFHVVYVCLYNIYMFHVLCILGGYIIHIIVHVYSHCCIDWLCFPYCVLHVNIITISICVLSTECVLCMLYI